MARDLAPAPARLAPGRHSGRRPWMRLAAIDIGTNSIHMVIAEASGPHALEVVEREREAVQMGRGSFGSRPIARLYLVIAESYSFSRT